MLAVVARASADWRDSPPSAVGEGEPISLRSARMVREAEEAAGGGEEAEQKGDFKSKKQ